jgi:hypothetical protein
VLKPGITPEQGLALRKACGNAVTERIIDIMMQRRWGRLGR